MSTLLIVDPHQFGYFTDTYKYCQYLRDAWDITVVCPDYGRRKLNMNRIRVTYVSRTGGRARRRARFIHTILRQLRSADYDIVFCLYFLGCSLLRAARPRRPIILDIRTGSVWNSRVRRRCEDQFLRWETHAFPRITIVSTSLMRRLRIDSNKCHVLPLGADPVETTAELSTGLHLLYVGTLFVGRQLHKTVEGLDCVYREMDGELDITYDIVGDGTDSEKAQLLQTIARSSCSAVVHYHGPVPNSELRPFLERNNVGVAFTPIVDYYDCQPSTKVFEYLLAGMPVLATATRENSAVINEDNGVLIEDSVEGFAEGVIQILRALPTYDRSKLQETARDHTWTNIVDNNLKTYLSSALVRSSRPPQPAVPYR
jgi:glycosyltransferase involved in cell wall biosynthesis